MINMCLSWKYLWLSAGVSVSGVNRLLGGVFHWWTILWVLVQLFKSNPSFVQIFSGLKVYMYAVIYSNCIPSNDYW